MIITCALLAAYAEVAQNGKISMIGGGLDTIQFPEGQPAVVPLPIYLIVRILVPANECGQIYQTRLEIIDADDGLVDLLGEQPMSPPRSEHGRPTKLAFAFAFQGTTFPAAGEYAIRLVFNGREMIRLPLYVEPIPPKNN